MFGLRIETGTERTTILDIFDIIQTVRGIGIYLNVEGEHSSRGSHKKVRDKLVGMAPTCAACQGYGTQILHMHTKKLRSTRLDRFVISRQENVRRLARGNLPTKAITNKTQDARS